MIIVAFFRKTIRPAHDHRQSDPSFVNIAFATMEIAVESCQIVIPMTPEIRTVVTGEHDDGVITNTQFIQGFQQTTYVAVHVSHHTVKGTYSRSKFPGFSKGFDVFFHLIAVFCFRN